MFVNNSEISAITKISQNKSIVSFGSINGQIKDFDVKSKNIIRRANIHDGSKITSMHSGGKFLVSASENGKIVVYDYINQQEFREIELARVPELVKATSLLFLKGEKHLVIGVDKGLAVLDIESTKLVPPTLLSSGVINLIRLSCLNESGKPAFISCTSTGSMRVWKEGDMQLKFVELIRSFNGHHGN